MGKRDRKEKATDAGTIDRVGIMSDPRVENGIYELARALQLAEDCDRDAWDFAIKIKSLHRLGLTDSDLRWLVCKGFVKHAREKSAIDSEHRVFRFSQSLEFGKKTCFVLSKESCKVGNQNGGTSRDLMASLGDLLQNPSIKTRPHWDAARHELVIGSQLVKRFRWPATNQEAVLEAFEEENWPSGGVFDPLPPAADKHPKQRLRDTIKCLNRHQTQKLIRFRGDGTGEKIVWELRDEVKTPSGNQLLQERDASWRVG